MELTQKDLTNISNTEISLRFQLKETLKCKIEKNKLSCNECTNFLICDINKKINEYKIILKHFEEIKNILI